MSMGSEIPVLMAERDTVLELRLAGQEILQDVPLARYTSARIGGPADWLVMAERVDQLVELVRTAQDRGISWRVLGSGSNVLVSDAGMRGLVIVNKAKKIVFEGTQVGAEAGANLSSLARNCIARGLAGLEWAVSVPGTVGGAVIGNAGAHGADIAQSLTSVEILIPDGTTERWTVERLEYGYRDSCLKRTDHRARPVVLVATFTLETAEPRELTKRADEYVARRKATQPPGASVGSMFKNPPGDYAGRLIEQAGLKGMQIGDAQISPVHANFFVNMGSASADDVKALIDLARERVRQRFGVELELEVELIGEW